MSASSHGGPPAWPHSVTTCRCGPRPAADHPGPPRQPASHPRKGPRRPPGRHAPCGLDGQTLAVEQARFAIVAGTDDPGPVTAEGHPVGRTLVGRERRIVQKAGNRQTEGVAHVTVIGSAASWSASSSARRVSTSIRSVTSAAIRRALASGCPAAAYGH
jgi:hypothetical protein